MAEVDFIIGHKEYRVAAQDGEERLLQRAAALLDAEAQQILSQAGRVPEPRLLLLAGLVLLELHLQLHILQPCKERLREQRVIQLRVGYLRHGGGGWCKGRKLRKRQGRLMNLGLRLWVVLIL